MNTASVAAIDTLRAPDGCRLRLRTLRPGRSEVPPVVFVHALAMNGEMWHDVVDALDTPATLLAPDCRGHGDSERPPGPYTTRQFALDLEAVLDHVGTRQAHVVGCSMGGTVALALAGLRPERIASLSVIDATACYGVNAEIAWEARGRRPAEEGFAAMLPFQVNRWFSEAYAARRPPAMQHAIDVFLRNDAAAYAESCRMLGRADERAGLARYRGPAAIVVGEDDYATPPAMAEDIAWRLAGATLTVLSKLRHYTPIEAPGRVAAAIASAMQRAAGAAREETGT